MGYPKATIAKVRDAFLSGEYASAKEIAKKYKIKRVETVYDWSKKYKWGTFREKVTRKIGEQIAEKATNSAADAITTWIMRHAAIGKVLQAKGVEKLRKLKPSEIDVKEATRMVAAGADIERKAMTLGKEELPVNLNLNFVKLYEIAAQPDEPAKPAEVQDGEQKEAAPAQN